MFVLALLTCIVLRAFSAQARVVTSFNDCSEFFYQNTEPSGMNQNAKKICQHLDNLGPYYATLYSVHHRIPLYSAYRFDPECLKDDGRPNIWHLEPQISQPDSTNIYMVPENTKNKQTFKQNQAISDDYKHTGYDRGHLNPNSFQYLKGRMATATLTNSAPMNACFNRIYWNEWEKTLKKFLIEMDEINKSATAYIVTGTVPSTNVKIPRREKLEDDRVTVPSHIWTAVCYKHNSDDTKSFSFSYMGKNQPERDIHLMRVSDLNKELTKLYNSEIKIFVNDCFGDNNKFNMAKDKFQKIIMSLDEQDTDVALKRAMSSESLASELNAKMRKVNGRISL